MTCFHPPPRLRRRKAPSNNRVPPLAASSPSLHASPPRNRRDECVNVSVDREDEHAHRIETRRGEKLNETAVAAVGVPPKLRRRLVRVRARDEPDGPGEDADATPGKLRVVGEQHG